MMKSEPIQLQMKRIACSIHGNNIKYKCQYKQCQFPYLCGESECIDEHFHDNGKLIIAKFNSTLWQSRFQQAQSIMNSNILKIKEENLQKIVRYFNESLQRIKNKMHKFEEIQVKICNSDVEEFNQQSLDDVCNYLTMGNKLQRKIDKLRSKINEDQIVFSQSQSQIAQEPIVQEEQDSSVHEQPPMGDQEEKNIQQNRQQQLEKHLSQVEDNNIEDHAENHQGENHQGESKNYQQERGHQILHKEIQVPVDLKENKTKQTQFRNNKFLIQLLQQNIDHFAWNKSKVIFNLNEPISCQKFHQRLRDKRNLLFIFIGEGFIIGSYYYQPYPSVSERFRKDNKSFIFIQDQQLQQKFALFRADSNSDSHISVSEKLLICQGNTPNNGDGLRTFQRTFDSLVYFLPSRSFRDVIEDRQVNYNGVLKIKEFQVLELSE